MSSQRPATPRRGRSTRTTLTGWKRLGAGLGLLLASFAVVGCGPELGPISKLLQIPSPQLPETSDPSAVQVGNTTYVYGSNSNVRAPVTALTDIGRTYSLGEKNSLTTNAMPTKPPWAVSSTQFWAPTVVPLAGRWLMFFSADRANPPQPNNPQCIGRAWADGPLGPFVAEATPATCGFNGTGGALDPELFTDPTNGNIYLLAAFGDTEAPIVVMQVYPNGAITGATSILARQNPWEYHFIEQPAMMYDWVRGDYLLTYSAGKWWEAQYSTGIARCSTPVGPCTSDPSGPWIASSAGRTGPGGLTFFAKGGTMYSIFSTFAAGGEGFVGGRSAVIMPVTLSPSVGLVK